MHIQVIIARCFCRAELLEAEGFLDYLSGGAQAAPDSTATPQASKHALEMSLSESFTTFSGLLRHTSFGVLHVVMMGPVARFSNVLVAFLKLCKRRRNVCCDRLAACATQCPARPCVSFCRDNYRRAASTLHQYCCVSGCVAPRCSPTPFIFGPLLSRCSC